MKKRVFSLIGFLCVMCLLSACLPEPPPGIEEEPPAEKTYYTLRFADDNSDTIGINVGGDVRRALSNGIAQASHDFFEVVFYYNGSNNAAIGHRVARTTWNAEEIPELRGVYRDVDVDYTNVSAPSAGSGSALLFAGSKDDKTLLAIGHLSHVDNQPVGAANLVGPNTTAVTFEVTALKAGVSFNVGNSSFRTYSTAAAARGFTGNGTTSISSNIYINSSDKKTFPFFKLGRTPNHENYGAYNFKVCGEGNNSSVPSPDTVFDFNRYAAGIVLAGDRNLEAVNPRYVNAAGIYQYSSLAQDVDIRSEGQLAFQNNDQTRGVDGYVPETGPKYFANPVVFKIDTSASNVDAVFALTFEIFVYNLTALPAGTYNPNASPAPPTPVPPFFPSYISPVKWRISPGIGARKLDLDDGSGGEGGAVLLGSGDVSAWLAPYLP